METSVGHEASAGADWSCPCPGFSFILQHRQARAVAGLTDTLALSQPFWPLCVSIPVQAHGPQWSEGMHKRGKALSLAVHELKS